MLPQLPVQFWIDHVTVWGASSGKATATNCWVRFTPTLTGLGVICNVIWCTFTDMESDALLSAWEVAVIVIFTLLPGEAGGAVYLPFASSVPQALPVHPPSELRLQGTAVLLAPVTVAVNCTSCPT